MKTIPVCPVCGETDHVVLVFGWHANNEGEISDENPSDLSRLYVCPDLHVYSVCGEEAEFIGNA